MTEVLKIKEGKAFLYSDRGCLIRTIGKPGSDTIVSGVISGDEIHLQGSSGKNYIYTKLGCLRRSF